MYIILLLQVHVHIHVAVHTVEIILSCAHLQSPEIDKCSMLAVKHYEVIISKEPDEIISHKIYNTTNFLFEHSDYQFNPTFIISITVINIKGQRSNSTVTTKTIGIQNMISSKYMDSNVQCHVASYILCL